MRGGFTVAKILRVLKPARFSVSYRECFTVAKILRVLKQEGKPCIR